MKKILFLSLLFHILLFSTIYAQNNPFITRWDLSKNGSDPSVLSFGVVTSGTVSYTWQEISPGTASGSGTFSGNTASIRNLPSNSVIDLRIFPTNFQRINISYGIEKSRLIDVKQWGNVVWASMEGAFYGCANLNISSTDLPNLSSTISMASMFASCTSLNGPANINSWNTSTVTDMNYMFAFDRIFNQNISSWNTSNVTNMSWMFSYAYLFNQDISNWNTTNVTDMGDMFYEVNNFNQNISNWNVSKVTNMKNMFWRDRAFNQNISGWNVSLVIDMSGMFGGAYAFNQDISSWNVSKVTNMSYMFGGATVFNQNIASWDISKVVNMSNMFNNAGAFNQNLGTWGTKFNSAVNLSGFLDNSVMGTANYDALILAINATGSLTNKMIGANFMRYCNSASARANLIQNKGWVFINDALSSLCNSEINLKGNNVSIPNGSNSTSTTNHTDFGIQNISSGTVVRTFTIENLGLATLSLTGNPVVTISGTHASDFTVTTFPFTSISGSGSTTFQITFDPSALGARIATVSISNNDSNENPYTFSIQGIGRYCSSLSISPMVVCEGVTQTITSTLTNGGISPSYSWTKNNVTLATTQNINISNAVLGDVYVLTMNSSADACANSVTITASLTIGVGCTSTITSITSGNWENASTWNFNRIPTAADIVIIDTNHNVSINTNNANAKKVETRSNAKIIYDNATRLKMGF